MALPRRLVEERPDDLRRLVRVWHRATCFIQEHPQAAYAVVASVYDRPPEEVAGFAEVDRILGLRGNQVAFSYVAGLESLQGSLLEIQAFRTARDPSERELDTTRLLDDRFIRELAE